jgi:hypothetical protein
MKTFSTPLVLALTATSLGLGAIAPAIAQDTPTPPAPPAATAPAAPADAFRHGPGRGGFGDMLGFGRGAEAVEIALVRLSYAIDLTDEQQALFDTLRTDALAAANAFDTAVEDLRPAMPAAGEAPAAIDLVERFENRIALETAQLDALQAVQPAFTAFFESLTDEQEAQLMPDPSERGPRMGRGYHPAGRPAMPRG